ncbi:hypothetical protein LDL08_06920 [Nonomuraea glycinis]|jgi:hypothetical protein|uniref:Uncharacterized protein n=1 Tax=Nonomuraea glycinis TaxID=2047744 RepID=A0A918A3S4_9ACTN|nr:hypothetical protein [Nonomuraea glycinis]MCA2175908.1 hypothetical protein [Nonomuraea glycinis]WSG71815.1 hypothetical protein OHA68_20860 [Nonomuraea glycinis]GGP05629.1 hypothetical protein GCM10012278_25930 [Nonomuraea glycinis]
MSCQHLVCAQCAHPVIEGRCSLCRANRERMHQHGFAGLTPALFALLLVVLLLVTLALRHLGGL